MKNGAQTLEVFIAVETGAADQFGPRQEALCLEGPNVATRCPAQAGELIDCESGHRLIVT